MSFRLRWRFGKRPGDPVALTLNAAGLSLTGGVITGNPTGSNPALLQQSDLTYLGAFRVPQIVGPDADTYAYGGTAVTYHPANNSLFICGFNNFNKLGEISIPALVDTPTIGNLNVSTSLQALVDPLGGQLGAINPSDSNSKYIGDTLVYGGSLYANGYSYYDGAVTQSSTLFKRPLTLSSGPVTGPFAIGNLYQNWVSGYLCEIPDEWKTTFGGPCLAGNCGVSIASAISNGPAAIVFDPADAGVTNPIPGVTAVGYPYTDNLAMQFGYQVDSGTNPYYNLTTKVRGVVFPEGTDTVLFVGRHGIGEYHYGTGTSNEALHGTPDGAGNTYYYDPADNGKGTHAYPYRYQMWAYDANDLAACVAGTVEQQEVVPYAVWIFTLPYEQLTNSHDLGGCAWDPATRRLYISQQHTDAGLTPIIHCFEVA